MNKFPTELFLINLIAIFVFLGSPIQMDFFDKLFAGLNFCGIGAWFWSRIK